MRRASTPQSRAPADAGVEELFPLILESIREGVFTVDEEFRITSFNREAERISQVPRAQAIGRPCYEVFRASICQEGCALRRTLRTGKPLRDVRIDVLDASMKTVPISVSTAVLKDASGRMRGGVEIFRDLSDVESLRRHYARTCEHWAENIEKNRSEAVRIAGEKRYRIWSIYLAGCAFGFAQNWMNIPAATGPATQ